MVLVAIRSGAAEAWRAHNPQVPGSKPGSEIQYDLNLPSSCCLHNAKECILMPITVGFAPDP